MTDRPSLASSDNKYSRLIRNIILIMIGNFASRVLSFIMVPYYTSILTTSDYGIADLISNTVLLALPLFSVLMDESLMRFTLDKSNDRCQVFTIACIISTVGFIVAMVLSPLLLLWDELGNYYAYIIAYYIVSWLYNIASAYVRGIDRIDIMTIAGVIHTMAYLVMNVVFLSYARMGVTGYLMAINLSNVVAIIYLLIKCSLYRNVISIRSVDWKLAKDMLRYSIPLIPDYLSWWVNGVSDRYILALQFDTSVTGIYSISYKIPGLLSQMTGVFSSAWKISSVDDFGSDESIQFYNKVYRTYSGIVMVLSAFLIVVSRPLAKILFAKEFYLAWKITPILIIAYVYNTLSQFIGSIFTASKRTNRLFLSSMTGASVNVILNFVLIPRLISVGAAIATVFSFATIWAINMLNTRRILPMDFYLRVIIPVSLLLSVEAIGVLQGSTKAYLIAVLCVPIIMAINARPLIYALKSVVIRISAFRETTNDIL